LNVRIAGTSGRAGQKASGYAARNAKKVLKNLVNNPQLLPGPKKTDEPGP
jgi:hypothetical protein